MLELAWWILITAIAVWWYQSDHNHPRQQGLPVDKYRPTNADSRSDDLRASGFAVGYIGGNEPVDGLAARMERGYWDYPIEDDRNLPASGPDDETTVFEIQRGDSGHHPDRSGWFSWFFN